MCPIRNAPAGRRRAIATPRRSDRDTARLNADMVEAPRAPDGPSHQRRTSGAVGFVAGCAAGGGLGGLGFVHLLDDAQIELVGVGQVLDVAQRLVLASRLELEVAVAQ